MLLLIINEKQKYYNSTICKLLRENNFDFKKELLFYIIFFESSKSYKFYAILEK